MKGNLIILFLVLWPIIGGLIAYIIGRTSKRGRDYFAILVTIIEFLAIIYLYPMADNILPSTFEWIGFSGSRLYFMLDGFRYIYGLIASIMWMFSTIFSREYFSHYRNRNRYYLFTLITFGSTMGVLLSGDLFTTYIFFEIMSLASYVMVIHDETPDAKDAAKTYLAVTIVGGLALLMGIFLIQYTLGTTEINLLLSAIQEYTGDMTIIYATGILMMVGFGGKAGMFPIHFWLPKAHTAAPAPASALLSGILTKTGIFGALVISSNIFLYDYAWNIGLFILSMISMFLGAFLALFSTNLKRTLALSSVSQIGFIIFGIAMQGILAEHNAIAARGTILHMLNHSLIKLALFMAAGVIYMKLHELDLNKIRGFGRGKPLLAIIFGIGAISLIGIPLTSGYLSKTLLHESIIEEIHFLEASSNALTFFQAGETLFTITGGLTAAYMIKLFVAIFIEKNPQEQEKFDSYNKRYMSPLSTIALLIPALILLILGIFPNIADSIAGITKPFMNSTILDHSIDYFIWINLKGIVTSLIIGVMVYFIMIRGFLIKRDEDDNLIYIDSWPKGLYLESIMHKSLFFKAIPRIVLKFTRSIGSLPKSFFSKLYNGAAALVRIFGSLPAKIISKLYHGGSMFVQVVGSIPAMMVSKGYSIFKSLEEVFHRPFDHEEEEHEKTHPTGTGIGRIISSSLSFGLIQFAIGLVLFSFAVIFVVFL